MTKPTRDSYLATRFGNVPCYIGIDKIFALLPGSNATVFIDVPQIAPNARNALDSSETPTALFNRMFPLGAPVDWMQVNANGVGFILMDKIVAISPAGPVANAGSFITFTDGRSLQVNDDTATLWQRLGP